MIGWVSQGTAERGRASGGNSKIHRDPTCTSAHSANLVPVQVYDDGSITPGSAPLTWCGDCVSTDAPGSWSLDAACRGADQSMFFAEENAHGHRYAKARAICKSCPVLGDCREYVRACRPEHGFWAGLSPKERAKAWR